MVSRRRLGIGARSIVAAMLIATVGCVLRVLSDGSEYDDGETSDGSDSEASVGDDSGGQTGCAASPEAMADCVEQQRYAEDLRFIADIRVPGTTHWQAVQDLCFDRFSEYGYEVELQDYGPGINVIGRREGSQAPQELVVIAAHYDHIDDCAGADDNATGVSGVLELARVLSEAEFDRTLVVACWDQEEVGLLGSRSFVQATTSTSDDVIVNFNFEMIGFRDDRRGAQSVPAGIDLAFPEAYAEVQANEFRGDFVALVYDDSAAMPAGALDRHAQRLGLPAVNLQVPAELKTSVLIADLRRSDHSTFWDADLPAIMITDTSEFRYANYHCGAGEDSADLLDDGFATAIVKSTAAAAVETLGPTAR